MRKGIEVDEAADTIGICNETLRRWQREGKAHAERGTNNKLLFTPEEVERLRAKKSEREMINTLFESADGQRIAALFDELNNGKGLARLKAEERIAEIQIDRELDDEHTVIDIDWAVTATKYAEG